MQCDSAVCSVAEAGRDMLFGHSWQAMQGARDDDMATTCVRSVAGSMSQQHSVFKRTEISSGDSGGMTHWSGCGKS
jgi:hypothetical protein